MKYADRLAWEREQCSRQLTILEVNSANLSIFFKKREPHWDDEDDTLHAAEQCIRFANEQIEEARRILEEGS